MLLLFIAIASSYEVPITVTQTELETYYKAIETFNLTVKQYEGQGLGLMLLTNITEHDVVFCLNTTLELRSSDKFPLSGYIKDFPAKEQLVARILYEKFMGKKDNFFNQYIHTLPTEINHFSLWTFGQLELFKKFNLYPSIETTFDRQKEYENYYNKVHKIYGINQDMLKYESFIWATGIVHSRSFLSTVNGAKVFVLPAYIDLANHWPNRDMKDPSGTYRTDDSNCIISGWNRTVGEQVYHEYSKMHSSSFFINYGFVVENDPNDYFQYTYKGKMPCDKCEYTLASSQVNIKLIEAITFDVGDQLSIGKDLREYLASVLNSKESITIMKALMVYRLDYTANTKFEGALGLRENRRQRAKDKIEAGILSFTIASRKEIYRHFRVLDQEILFTFSKLLF